MVHVTPCPLQSTLALRTPRYYIQNSDPHLHVKRFDWKWLLVLWSLAVLDTNNVLKVSPITSSSWLYLHSLVCYIVSLWDPILPHVTGSLCCSWVKHLTLSVPLNNNRDLFTFSLTGTMEWGGDGRGLGLAHIGQSDGVLVSHHLWGGSKIPFG